jgi:ribosome recycling factor
LIIFLSNGVTINTRASGLVIPQLTEERRKELAKEVKKESEGAKIAVRNIHESHSRR